MGTGFTGATGVSFGAVPASSYVVNNASQITAVAPAGSAETVDVTVTTSGGTSAIGAADQFSYFAAETITFAQPATPVMNGSAPITLTATASSGLAVTFTVISGPGAVSGANGTTLTFTGAGSVVVEADQAGGGMYSAAAPVQQTIVVNAAAASYVAASTPVGTTSAVQTATVTFPATGSGTLGAISVVTQGATGLDFVVASGGTCSVGMTVVSGEACTVNYTFAPTRASTRLGGIVVADSSGNALANSYVSGLGTGPQIAFPAVNSNAVTTTLASGGNNVEGVAVDGSGDVFYSNASANTIVELVAVNGAIPPSPSAVTFAANGTPVALAVDGSGNLYAAGFNGNMTEYVAINGSLAANPVRRSFTTGMVNPQSIAVDRNGNVYIGDAGSNRVLELSPVNGVIPTSAAPAVIGSGYQAVFGVAVDTAGDVFVSDHGAKMVYELMAVGGSLPANPTVNGVGSGFSIPLGLSVDALGDVYVSDQGSKSVKEVVAVNGAVSPSSTILTLGSGFTTPVNSAIDANGNLYIADNANSNVREFNVVAAPALTYANTAVGSSSTAQGVVVENIGNAALTVASLTASANFNLGGAGGTCATGSLGVAARCNLSIVFAPAMAGMPLSGTVNLTDNSVNVVGAVQTVALSGSATQVAQSITWPRL
jgi:sugar lactone lactonase YvrE